MLPAAREATLSLSALGAVYAAFSFLLYRANVTPRAVWLPIDPASYYLAQALFVAPLFILLTVLYVAVLRALLPARDGATFRAAYLRLAPAYAWPLLFLFVVPDLVVFLVAGHAALPRAMRFYGPLAPIAIVALSVVRARPFFGASTGRASLASFAGLVAQAVVGALVLR